jgi:hypothetical protein
VNVLQHIHAGEPEAISRPFVKVIITSCESMSSALTGYIILRAKIRFVDNINRKGSKMDNNNHQVKYPYARLTGMTQFMDCLRNEPEWKPDVINADLLRTLDIAKGKESEAVYALKFLGIITDDGTPTEEFDNLRQDYTGTMNRLVREKYKELFNRIPISMINQSRLVKFFGSSVETAEYRAKLFGWFCEQAGIELPNLEKEFHRARFDKKNGNKQNGEGK